MHLMYPDLWNKNLERSLLKCSPVAAAAHGLETSLKVFQVDVDAMSAGIGAE